MGGCYGGIAILCFNSNLRWEAEKGGKGTVRKAIYRIKVLRGLKLFLKGEVLTGDSRDMTEFQGWSRENGRPHGKYQQVRGKKEREENLLTCLLSTSSRRLQKYSHWGGT